MREPRWRHSLQENRTKITRKTALYHLLFHKLCPLYALLPKPPSSPLASYEGKEVPILSLRETLPPNILIKHQLQFKQSLGYFTCGWRRRPSWPSLGLLHKLYVTGLLQPSRLKDADPASFEDVFPRPDQIGYERISKKNKRCFRSSRTKL